MMNAPAALLNDTTLVTFAAVEPDYQVYLRRYTLPYLSNRRDSLFIRTPIGGGSGEVHSLFITADGDIHVTYERNTTELTRLVGYRVFSSRLQARETASRSAEVGITIWPNPTRGFVMLRGDISRVQSVAIFNILGQRVDQFDRHSSSARLSFLDLQHLSTGRYFVHLLSRTGQVVLPVTIMR